MMKPMKLSAPRRRFFGFRKTNRKAGLLRSGLLMSLLLLCLPLSLNAWNLEILDTGRNVEWLSPVEKDVILELNKVRSDPARYAAEVLVPMRSRFQGNIYNSPDGLRIRTNEGIRALNECIRELTSSLPREALAASEGLSQAAQDHVDDTGPRGLTGHNGSRGSTMSSRIERYVKWDIRIGENISYGNADAVGIVAQLLIDDGVPSRGHRENIMNSEFAVVGVAVGSHSVYRSMCVQDFAGAVREL